MSEADLEITYTLNKWYHFHSHPVVTNRFILKILLLPVDGHLRFGTDKSIGSLPSSLPSSYPPQVTGVIKFRT